MRHVYTYLLFCSLVPALAFSQRDYPTAELYGGYSYLNIGANGLSSRVSANGWEGSVSGNISKWFAVESVASGHYKNSEYDYGTLFGPRLNIRPVFFHALFGFDYSTIAHASIMESLSYGFGGGVQWN